MLELRAKERVEAAILDQIIGTYLSEFVKDVAQETLKAGLLAKRRAEDEVMLESLLVEPSCQQISQSSPDLQNLFSAIRFAAEANIPARAAISREFVRNTLESSCLKPRQDAPRNFLLEREHLV